MRTKLHQWIDTNKDKDLFGIEVSRDGKEWFYLSSHNSPMLFETEEEAERVRTDVRYVDYKFFDVFFDLKRLSNKSGQKMKIANIVGED
jgi:hypothetical protein